MLGIYSRTQYIKVPRNKSEFVMSKPCYFRVIKQQIIEKKSHQGKFVTPCYINRSFNDQTSQLRCKRVLIQIVHHVNMRTPLWFLKVHVPIFQNLVSYLI